jgi:hypothetical protein
MSIFCDLLVLCCFTAMSPKISLRSMPFPRRNDEFAAEPPSTRTTCELHDQGQQGGPAHRYGKLGREALAGPPGQGHRDRTQQAPESTLVSAVSLMPCLARTGG